MTPASCPEKRESVLEDVRELLQHGIFKVVMKEELPDGANALTPRSVLAIRSNFRGNAMFNARCVICGHRDKLKYYMVHGSQTPQS